MSTSEQNIIHISKNGLRTSFNLEESKHISSSSPNWSDWDKIRCYHDSQNSALIIEILNETITVVFHHSSKNTPLHVHMIFNESEVYNDKDDKFYTITDSYTLFIIFQNRIVKINLEDIGSGWRFKNRITDKSFMISSDSFQESNKSFFKKISENHVISCLVQNQTCCIKEIVLVEDDDEHLFYTGVQFSFELPSSFTVINYNEEHWCGNCIGIDGKLDGMENPSQLYIYYDGNTDKHDDLQPIYLLKEGDRCILAKNGQLDRFQIIGFEIVATIYISPYDEDEDRPEILDFIRGLLELNKYHRSRWDSDCGSDSD
jgi:hypothetical protein